MRNQTSALTLKLRFLLVGSSYISEQNRFRSKRLSRWSKERTASSSSFFILFSVFIFPDPLPWKRWDSCLKAYTEKEQWAHYGWWSWAICSSNCAITGCTDLFRGKLAPRLVHVFNLNIWLVAIFLFKVLGEAPVFLSPAVFVIDGPEQRTQARWIEKSQYNNKKHRLTSLIIVLSYEHYLDNQLFAHILSSIQ